jgi:hypothetical protein
MRDAAFIAVAARSRRAVDVDAGEVGRVLDPGGRSRGVRARGAVGVPPRLGRPLPAHPPAHRGTAGRARARRLASGGSVGPPDRRAAARGRRLRRGMGRAIGRPGSGLPLPRTRRSSTRDLLEVERFSPPPGMESPFPNRPQRYAARCIDHARSPPPIPGATPSFTGTHSAIVSWSTRSSPIARTSRCSA